MVQPLKKISDINQNEFDIVNKVTKKSRDFMDQRLKKENNSNIEDYQKDASDNKDRLNTY